MVCDRCKLVISNILDELEIPVSSVSLGVIDFGDVDPDDYQIKKLKNKIESIGFEIIQNKKSQTIEEIKVAIIELINVRDEFVKINVSSYLSEKLQHDYVYLSNLFSMIEGITIEQYLINQKIEKVKELIIYNELSLTEISQELGYSSLSHLSNQFKKVTGVTPSHFKKIKNEKYRKPLDKV